MGRASRRAGESGFTLIEVLIVALLLAVVLIPVMGSLDFAQTQTPKVIEYSQAISNATTALQRMMQEIRQAYRINATDGDPSSGVGTWIEFNAVINDQDLEIKYECDVAYPTNTGNKYASQYHRCMRVSAPTGSGLPAISRGSVAVDRVLNPDVFTFIGPSGTPNPVYPTYVMADVQVPSRGPLNLGLAHKITLDNATAIPNLENGT
jgi:prepilin-type N-terminal cleavage/methylation domain-containing protein